MRFMPTLAAIICGLLVSIILVNACVGWGRAAWQVVRSHPQESWLKRLYRVGALSVRNKGPWVLAAVITGIFLLPPEPWASGLLAAGMSWIVFILVMLLFAALVTWVYAAVTRKRTRPARQDDAA